MCVIHTHTHTHTRIDYQALHVLSGKQLLDIADLEFVHFWALLLGNFLHQLCLVFVHLPKALVSRSMCARVQHYTHTYRHTYTHTHVSTAKARVSWCVCARAQHYTHTHTHKHTHIRVCMCCVCACVYFCVRDTYVCVVCVHVSICVCVCVHTQGLCWVHAGRLLLGFVTVHLL